MGARRNEEKIGQPKVQSISKNVCESKLKQRFTLGADVDL